MIQFCYSRLYLGLEIVSCRLLLKMTRMYMDLKLNNVAQLFQVLMLYACSGGGGDSAYERVGMPVVSLRGVTFGFWSHLGCSGQNAITFSREGLV